MLIVYSIRSYITAAYEFESFTKAFPRSDKLEEAYYLTAYAYAEISPIFSLDQKDTEEALNKLQEYINRYPRVSAWWKSILLLKNCYANWNVNLLKTLNNFIRFGL